MNPDPADYIYGFRGHLLVSLAPKGPPTTHMRGGAHGQLQLVLILMGLGLMFLTFEDYPPTAPSPVHPPPPPGADTAQLLGRPADHP